MLVPVANPDQGLGAADEAACGGAGPAVATEVVAQPAGTAPYTAFWRQVANELTFLQRAVRRLRLQRADAADLVQETLVKALANAHLWQPGSDLRAWLFTIMRNQLRADAKKTDRSLSTMRLMAAVDPEPAADGHEAGVMLHQLGAALNRLPAKQSRAIRLVGIEGESYEAAAAAMGISVGAVRCHLARGRERLRKLMHAVDTRLPFAPRPVRAVPAMASGADTADFQRSRVPLAAD